MIEKANVTTQELLDWMNSYQKITNLLQDYLRELLDAILWDAFSEEDETLEIDRKVAERLRRLNI